MGFLDEAIREHLELKRRRGATDSELRRMEDEAFGPPARPDEAEFAEAESASEPSGNGFAETTVAQAPPMAPPESPAEEPAEPLSEAVGESDEAATTIHPPPMEEEPAREHQVVPEEPLADEQPADEPEPEPGEPPIESLETVEHPFPEQVEDPERPVEEGEPAPAEREPPAEGEDGEALTDEGEAPQEGEDVLADTPEFLKDAPEDEELWFEQGQPKDFDF
jgi:hypothetical protein